MFWFSSGFTSPLLSPHPCMYPLLQVRDDEKHNYLCNIHCKQNLYFVFKPIRYKDISNLTISPYKDRDLQSIFAEFFLNVGTTDAPFSSAGKEVIPKNIFEIASGQTGVSLTWLCFILRLYPLLCHRAHTGCFRTNGRTHSCHHTSMQKYHQPIICFSSKCNILDKMDFS